ncbi:MAG TPA: c-type cytochrome [Thermoanaerobaculia bacterium]|jgi:photosynthetic reaction center cytochrome c subunit|nr:c-type cytochrome [Thermoanaerobaculia bacterium]
MRKTLAAAALLLFATNATPEDQPKESPVVTQMLKALGPNAKKPAGEVFRNVQLMKDVPADRFLRIMDTGYRQSLGVSCDYCHVEDRWETDEKRPKRAAREMILMTRMINNHLTKLAEINTEEASVNCTTCHRGYVKPALQMR